MPRKKKLRAKKTPKSKSKAKVRKPKMRLLKDGVPDILDPALHEAAKRGLREIQTREAALMRRLRESDRISGEDLATRINAKAY